MFYFIELYRIITFVITQDKVFIIFYRLLLLESPQQPTGLLLPKTWIGHFLFKNNYVSNVVTLQ